MCDSANLRAEHAKAIRYVLCTALDEAANRTSWGQEHDWATHSLSVLSQQDADGGETVFQFLGNWIAVPHAHADVLEILYQVLCLGFQGRYAGKAEGPRELEAIRQRLANVLADVRGPVVPVLPTQQERDERWRVRHE